MIWGFFYTKHGSLVKLLQKHISPGDQYSFYPSVYLMCNHFPSGCRVTAEKYDLCLCNQQTRLKTSAVNCKLWQETLNSTVLSFLY